MYNKSFELESKSVLLMMGGADFFIYEFQYVDFT